MSKIKGLSHIVLHVNDLEKWSRSIGMFSGWSNIARTPGAWCFSPPIPIGGS